MLIYNAAQGGGFKIEDLKVGTVIVTFNPELARFKEVIESVSTQMDRIFIVDNNSNNRNEMKKLLKFYSNVEVIENDRNYGIGKGLNVGTKVLKESVDWILTLDQDSIVLTDIKDLLRTINSERVGIISLNYKESSENTSPFYHIKYPIISGSIINSEVFKSGIEYREEFFLDHVDTDFDVSVRRRGFEILVTKEKYLSHQWGTITKSTNRRCQNNLRIYLTVRNGTRLFLERKIDLKTYILDNVSYTVHFCKKLKNALLVFVVTLLAFSDGFVDKFIFFEKFKT